jgi:hypothetical protein
VGWLGIGRLIVQRLCKNRVVHYRSRSKRFEAGRLFALLVVLLMLSGCMEALSTGTTEPTRMPQPIAPTHSATPPQPTATVSSGIGAPNPSTDPAVTTPTLVATPTLSATATLAPPTATPVPPLVVATLPALTHEERWRAQQIDREVFDPMRTYRTTGSELWWYDPVHQQSLVIGSFSGDFVAQARFTLRGQGVTALEVPYRVNESFGLTALSPAILERIRAAGYGEWIETYVFAAPHVIEN